MEQKEIVKTNRKKRIIQKEREFRDRWSYFVIALHMSKISSTNETKNIACWLYQHLKANEISNRGYSIVLRLYLGVVGGPLKYKRMLTEGRGHVNTNLSI